MIKTGHICLDILLSDYHCKISGIVLNENYYIAILRFFRHIENQISMFLYSKQRGYQYKVDTPVPGLHYSVSVHNKTLQHLADQISNYYSRSVLICNVQSVKSRHQNFRFFGKKLLISRLQSWDWSQMKALVILHTIGVISNYQNPLLFEK